MLSADSTAIAPVKGCRDTLQNHVCDLIAQGQTTSSFGDRKMAASLPGLREIANPVIKVHHGCYPHPSHRSGVLQHQSDYFDYIKDQEDLNDPSVLPNTRKLFLHRHAGAKSARATFTYMVGLEPKHRSRKTRPAVGASASAWRVRLSAAANPCLHRAHLRRLYRSRQLVSARHHI